MEELYTVFTVVYHNGDYSNVLFHENSFVSFINNTARCGGAIHSHTNSRVTFDDFSITTFSMNIAN